MATKERTLQSFFGTVQNVRILDLFYKQKNVSISGAGNATTKAFIVFELLKKFPDYKKVVWVVNDKSEQENLVKNLHMWSTMQVCPYTYEEGNDKHNFTQGLAAVGHLNDPLQKIVVAPYQTILQNVPSKRELDMQKIPLKEGQKVTNIELIDAFVDAGYQVAPGDFLEKGMYYQQGGILTIFPVNSDHPLRIELAFDTIESMDYYEQENGKKTIKKLKKYNIYPININQDTGVLVDYFDKHTLVVEDEIDVIDEFFEAWNSMMEEAYEKSGSLRFTTFNEDVPEHVHLHYLSVLKYRDIYDFITDIRAKQKDRWKVVIFTKKEQEIKNILKENNVPFLDNPKKLSTSSKRMEFLHLYTLDKKEDLFPKPFQNPELKLLFLTDKDIVSFREESKKPFNQKVYLDFLTGLKPGDYVVHADHGIAQFLGLDRKTIDEVTREYMKLGYAENDKLFVPIDQADKVNKYIGADEHVPKLTRLGSAEWSTITNRVKKETEKIAKELLVLYAKRRSAKGTKFKKDNNIQEKFEATFPYEETPGQIKAINDVKEDMEKQVPMDRLICGDVGFGKTEVAMRAAFKAVQDKKQVALVSPITILADQHYRSFTKRMDPFNIRVAMLSRFKTQKQQKEIIKQVERGEVDI
ncbi:DEAD/DEAH box helicase, partial [Candidatus Peregrinibacteria bacterium]|nr:DEAD/DEAH box helicase [Candidatus Peregrinibacteria bacterium]